MAWYSDIVAAGKKELQAGKKSVQKSARRAVRGVSKATQRKVTSTIQKGTRKVTSRIAPPAKKAPVKKAPVSTPTRAPAPISVPRQVAPVAPIVTEVKKAAVPTIAIIAALGLAAFFFMRKK